MAAVARDGNNPINNQRNYYAEDSFSDVDDRFKGNWNHSFDFEFKWREKWTAL